MQQSGESATIPTFFRNMLQIKKSILLSYM